MKIYDITRTMSPSMIVYPGNPPVEFEVFEGETSTHTKVLLAPILERTSMLLDMFSKWKRS
jgi:hypothetical protein